MAHTITVTDSVPDATPRTYTAPTLPDLIRIVLRDELDLTAEDLGPPTLIHSGPEE